MWINNRSKRVPKFIWGIKSRDDISGRKVCYDTLNDIDLTYDRSTRLYSLEIETIYFFENREAECRYLRRLLSALEQYMDEHSLSKTEHYDLFTISSTKLEYKGYSISEVYSKFRMFVEGFCVVNK